MKKPAISLIFILLSALFQITSAQVRTSSGQNKSGFYVGITLAPTIIYGNNFRYYNCCSPSAGKNVLAKGIHAGYNFKKRIEVQTGFEYFSANFSKEKISQYRIRPAVPSNYFSTKYDIQYFQFPVLIKTYLNKTDKKLSWYIPLGIVYRYQSMKEQLFEYDSEDNLINTTSDRPNEQFLMWNLGFGACYKLSSKLAVFAEPSERVGFFNKFWDYENFKWQSGPLSYSIKFGVNYYF